MSDNQPLRTKIGDVCAHIPARGTGRAKYLKLGIAFRDDLGRISMKLDVLPLADSGWRGWINIFDSVARAERDAARDPRPDPDDDIPF